jgi:hypothetical protein
MSKASEPDSDTGPFDLSLALLIPFKPLVNFLLNVLSDFCVRHVGILKVNPGIAANHSGVDSNFRRHGLFFHGRYTGVRHCLFGI